MRYIFLLLLIVASIGVFVALIIPRWDDVKVTRANVASYESNLAVANQLQVSRQALIAQYNGISKTDLDNITTLLPDSVDNIRLIIQLDALATKNGLSSLRSVDYNPDQLATTATDGSADPTTSLQPYGNFVISFETSGQYGNFLSFLSDVESNLRLVDITEVDFNPLASSGSTATNLANGMDYKVTLTTYWLKQ